MLKRIILLIVLLLLVTSFSYSQSYLGYIKKKTNLREEPSSSSSILLTLKPGSQIFIVSLETINNFYNVIDIETNTEGYISESYIQLGEEVYKNKEGIFSPYGSTGSYNPEVKIHNNTSKTLTLILNSESYTFSPQEQMTITVSPGSYEFRASAPGVIPNYGTQLLEKNMGYDWEFYIITERK